MREYFFSESGNDYPDTSGFDLIMGNNKIAIYHHNIRHSFLMMKRVAADTIAVVEISKSLDGQAYELSSLLSGQSFI